MQIPPGEALGMSPERRQRLRCILWSMRAAGEGHYNISRLLLNRAGEARKPQTSSETKPPAGRLELDA